MKTTDVSTLIEPKLIAAFNEKHGIDIQQEYRKYDRDRRVSLFCIFTSMFLGLCLGAKAIPLSAHFCAETFRTEENLLVFELLCGVIFPFIVYCLPLAIFYRFIPFFYDKNYGVVVSGFKKTISKFREHYYTGSPDVCLTEELIRQNLVSMARMVLLQKFTFDFLKKTGWANEKTLREANEKYLQAEEILDAALASMNEFGLDWDKKSIFAKAGNA
jgi:hypothetical protein